MKITQTNIQYNEVQDEGGMSRIDAVAFIYCSDDSEFWQKSEVPNVAAGIPPLDSAKGKLETVLTVRGERFHPGSHQARMRAMISAVSDINKNILKLTLSLVVSA